MPNFLCLKCSGSWVVSIKQNTDFNIQPPSTFIYNFFTKVVLLKVIHYFKICQHTRLHGRTLTGAKVLHPPSKFGHPQFWNGWGYRVEVYTVHRSRVDPRKECESCGNARFRERKSCSLLSNVKTFALQRKKWTRLLRCLNCPMFAVRLWITTYLYRWPIGSLPSTCMLCTPPALH
jgi:hypothetical protein